MRKLQQKGFTLVEIAIVLVIIGLLLGGVLKGQELITNSKIKAAVNDYKGTAAAVYGYYDRYRAYPGDDANATSRFTQTVTNGDGDGIIEGNWNAATGESSQVWAHLRASGLFNGSGVTRPIHAFGGQIGITGNQNVYNVNQDIPRIAFGNMVGEYAAMVDTNMDDGILNNGKMYGANWAADGTTTYNRTDNYNPVMWNY